LISKQIITKATLKRPKTTILMKESVPESLSHLPVVRGRLPEYRVGQFTASGLRITSDRSTIQLELAKMVYRKPPFIRPSAVFFRPTTFGKQEGPTDVEFE
jgi:hypothetical protein